MSSIKLIITGGTIDKRYNELDGSLVFTESHMPLMLEQSRCQITIASETVMLKDSLDMNADDRQLVKNACIKSHEKHLIISHGTDTMVETAEVLAKAISDKTIVLFGAMVPYTISNSDSLFNLGCAISAVQCAPTGVYIAMNGKLFPWNDVKKNRQEGVFQNKL